MDLVISANDKYCMPVKIMVTSFLENNRFEHHNIYFLYGNVKTENLQNLAEYIEGKYDASFVPIKMDEEDVRDLPLRDHFSVETYYRFWSQEVLPDEVDRVLWLDADMIVMDSLREFYYQNFEGKCLVVCQSINQNSQEVLNKLEVPIETIYFNAGTILFNLKLIRETYKVSDYFEYIDNNREKITWLDQDVLNAIFCKKTKIDNYKKYNYQMFSDEKFDKVELRKIEKETCIIHFIGPVKPWHHYYDNPCGKFFLKYAKSVWTPKETIIYRIKQFLHLIKVCIIRNGGRK